MNSISNVLLLKAQLGSSPWQEGKAHLERYQLDQEKSSLNGTAVPILDIAGFPPGLPSDPPSRLKP